MASTLIKITSIGGGLATATGAGVGIAYLTSDSPKKIERTNEPGQEIADSQEQIQKTSAPKEIKAYLTSQNRAIPEKEADNSKWNKQWEVFKKKYESVNDLPEGWKIGTWTDLKNQKDAPDKFKEKCIENGNKKVTKTDESIFTEVKEYCSIEKVAGDV